MLTLHYIAAFFLCSNFRKKAKATFKVDLRVPCRPRTYEPLPCHRSTLPTELREQIADRAGFEPASVGLTGRGLTNYRTTDPNYSPRK